MKKNDALILIAVSIYTYLFYDENPGINYLIFTILLVALLGVKDKSNIKNFAWLACASGALISGICILLHSTILAVTANIISLSLLASFSINRDSSLVFAGLYSIYSYLSAIPYIAVRSNLRLKQNTSTQNIGTKVLIVLIPIVISLVFFTIYREANPVFKKLTDEINLDFISWSWVRFVLLGWILLYAFFNNVNIPAINYVDVSGQDNLKSEAYYEFKPRITYENTSGVILLCCLNLLLLSVNIIDVQSLFISSELPEGLTHSEMVHQGIGLLIISIIIAISLILYFFRGELNFYNSNKWIKFLAYIWIIQNGILVLTTINKNQMYINEYSLTYKRIGVYIYLLLTLIGLITTFIKIISQKSNWFLIRKNAWAFYSVLILSCILNWDLFITKYNIIHSKNIDKQYLLNLSESSITELVKLPETNEMKADRITRDIDKSIYTFLDKQTQSGWQSWDMEDSRIENELIDLNKNNLLVNIDLSDKRIETLHPLNSLSNLQSFNLHNTGFKKLEELNSFDKVKKLTLSSNQIDSIVNFPSLPLLNELDLSGNNLSVITGIQSCPNIESLTLSNLTTPILEWPELPKLTYLNLRDSEIKNISNLNKYSGLKELHISEDKKEDLYKFCNLPNLKIIELSHMGILANDVTIWENISKLKSLQTFDISNNLIANLNFLASFQDVNLTDLILSGNPITNLKGIEFLPNLKTLNLDNCKLVSITDLSSNLELENLSVSGNNFLYNFPIPTLTNLKTLNISNNSLSTLASITELTQLEDLNVSTTGISDISILKDFKNLRKLNLNNNSIRDLKPLMTLPNLEELILFQLNEESINALKKMKNLKKLQVYSMTMNQESELRKILPKVEIGKIYELQNEEITVSSTY